MKKSIKQILTLFCAISITLPAFGWGGEWISAAKSAVQSAKESLNNYYEAEAVVSPPEDKEARLIKELQELIQSPDRKNLEIAARLCDLSEYAYKHDAENEAKALETYLSEKAIVLPADVLKILDPKPQVQLEHGKEEEGKEVFLLAEEPKDEPNKENKEEDKDKIGEIQEDKDLPKIHKPDEIKPLEKSKDTLKNNSDKAPKDPAEVPPVSPAKNYKDIVYEKLWADRGYFSRVLIVTAGVGAGYALYKFITFTELEGNCNALNQLQRDALFIIKLKDQGQVIDRYGAQAYCQQKKKLTLLRGETKGEILRSLRRLDESIKADQPQEIVRGYQGVIDTIAVAKEEIEYNAAQKRKASWWNRLKERFNQPDA